MSATATLGRLAILAAAIALTAHTAGAQVETSTSIRGLVTDSTAGAIPGASVEIRNTATNEVRSVQTDGSGFYAFPSVVPGAYNITVTRQGFKRGEVKNVVAQVTQSAQVDVQLQIGQISDSVTVSGEGAELLSTTAEVAGTIVNKLVDNLPLNGRNFFDLAVLLPHVSLENLGPQMSFAGAAVNTVFGTNQSNPVFRSAGIFAADALYPQSLAAEMRASAEQRRPRSFETAVRQHTRNFMDCIRSRQRPNAPVEVAQYTSVTLCMAVQALRTGRKIHWDNVKGRIVA